MVPANFDFWARRSCELRHRPARFPRYSGRFGGNPGLGAAGSLVRGKSPFRQEAIASRSTNQKRRSLLLMKILAVKLSTLALVAVTCLCLGTVSAFACGVGGYSYAGPRTRPLPPFGIGATVTPLGGFNVVDGHVAGWVGVGGPHQGPNGSNEWLQVGFSGFPELTGNNLYYELTLPDRPTTYHQLGSNLPMGKPARFAVLEMHGRPDWWRVWLNGSPASKPIYMPGSHRRWSPIATDGRAGTAEQPAGATASCTASAGSRSPRRREAAAGSSSCAATRSPARRLASSGAARRARSSQRRATSPSARSHRSVRDDDRHTERRVLTKLRRAGGSFVRVRRVLRVRAGRW